MAQLTLSFLGTFLAVLDGKPLGNFRSARVKCLLAYLAIEARPESTPEAGAPWARPHTRDVLAALLWPDEPEKSAKQNLRQSIYQLRQLLGEPPTPFLLVTHDTVQLNPASDITLDVAAF